MKSPGGGVFALILIAALSGGASGQQNKVIIRNFDWKVTSTEHFDIHYYDDSAPWVDYAGRVLETAYESVTGDLDEPLDKKRSFFLYATVNDMEQSNIVDVGDGVGGVTEMFKDRFMVYCDGSRAWLDDVITHEFTHVTQFSVLLEGFWKSARIIKTYVYPLWMMEGMSEYETGDKDIAIENLYMRDASTSNGLISLVKLLNFAHLKPHQTTLAYKEGGAAIRFLAAEYGKDKVAKMLRLFVSRYDVGSVLNALIGLDIFAFDRKFREYLELKYAREVRLEALKEPERYGDRITSQKENIPEFNTSPALSSDGSVMAYISTHEGHPQTVRVRDLKTGREKKWTGFDVGAENIPMGRFTQIERNLAISPDGKWIVFSGQKNHREYLYLIDRNAGKVRKLAIPGMMAVGQPRFSGDGGKIAFVGMKKGFTDIYTLAFTSGVAGGFVSGEDIQRITDDPDDDSSPAFSPDGGSIVYSCEVETSSGPKRDICVAGPGGGPRRKLVELNGNERDPVFSPDGKRVMFVGDGSGVFELYEKEISSGRISRMTRTVGGNFTPAYSKDGRDVYFASFRRGSVNIHKGQYEAFLDEEVPGHGGPASSVAGPVTGKKPGFSPVRPYRFGASTDLFFPAFFYSSLGGFFLTTYWQGSDNLGNNTAQLFLSGNTGSKYLNYQAGYAYARFRPQLFFQAAGYTVKDTYTVPGLTNIQTAHRQVFGVMYPFDRYHGVQAAVLNKTETIEYPDFQERNDYQTRAGIVSFTRDTVNGRYLVATRGNRLQVSYIEAFNAFGGNLQYKTQTVEAHQYIPLGNQSAFALRLLEAGSYGFDRQAFEIGGVGWIRGFQRSPTTNIAERFVIGTAELRFPLIQDMNYYVWYFFPDFYFKAIFAKVFTDAGMGWFNDRELRSSKLHDVMNSVGVGIQIHTFILQAFPMVLTFDYVHKTNNGGRVLYFYLGPIF